MLRLPEPWNTVRRQAKRAFWAVVVLVAPMAIYYELHRFLMPKLQAGDWTWWLIVMGGLFAFGFAWDVATGHFDFARWWRRRPRVPGQDCSAAV
jgi:hypothetical protein